MRCPRCQEERAADARFCLACGARLAAACAACGVELPAGARFCPGCGLAVTGVPAPPAGAPPPATYTPPHLAERILTARSALEGERKAVTVLFCDLVESTPLAERLGAEGMHELLGRFFETALAEVHRYEGTVNQFLGDGFMALFGAPLAHEDHARRAVLAALGVARALRERPLDAGAAGPVAMRMGLHTGFVVVGMIGDNLRMDYTAVGDTTHLAARLQQHAAPGMILISDATARLVADDAVVESLGPIAVKGKTEPVSVFRVVGPAPRRSTGARLAERALSRFVGRGQELATLLDRLERAVRGEGQVVGIVGEPGLGKSRLLLELRRSLGGRPVAYHEGRCLSYGSPIPYLPVLDLLRSQLGLLDADTPEVVSQKVRDGLRGVRLVPDEGAPYLLQLLGVKETPDPLAAVAPEAVKARTFETLRQLALRAAHERPLVLAVEDVHWVDRTSEAYLGFLVEALAGAPILLLTTSRPGHRPPWMEASFATQLALTRLAPADSLTVVRAVLPAAAVAEPLAGLILDKAEGNPFFLEELARAVGDQGLRAGLTVPDTVHGVLTARIDRLAEAPKRLLQTAAILGREFPVRWLEAVWDGARPIEPHLRELTRLEFLYQRASGEEPLYVFKHALTQDVAEATLLAPRRREIHRRAAEALTHLHAERLDELAPVLAHHYAEAEAWAPAAHHAREAAQAAQAVFANQEALARYDQALSCAERAGLSPAERRRLHEARAEVHAVLGAFEPARADLEAARALARESGDAAAEGRVLGALGMLWGGHQDYEQGLALTREAVTRLEEAGDDGALAEARMRLGIMRLNLAQMTESRLELTKALALFRARQDVGGQGRTLDALAMAATIAGDCIEGVRAAEAALPLLQTAGDRPTEVSCRALLGFALFYRGEPAAARPHVEAALAGARLIGAKSQEAFVRFSTGEALEPYGAYGEALREEAAALALARELGHREWIAAALATLGRVRRRCGDVAGARQAHEEMLATARALRTTLWIADALGELGADEVEAGDRASGAAHLAEAVRTGGEALKFTIRPRLALAELALAEGRVGDALAAARSVRELAPQFRVFAADARRLEGEALLAFGRPAEARAALAEAKVEAAALEAAPPRWRAALALARLLDAAGRPADAAAERAEARALLEAVAGDLPDADLRRTFQSTAAMREARAEPV